MCIVPTKVFQYDTIKFAHQGHQGLNETKVLLRTKIFFWGGLEKPVENKLTNCVFCQTTTTPNSAPVIQPSPLPPNVWEIVNLHYLGPLPNGKYVLVLID